MSRNKSRVSGVQVYQEYALYCNISGYIKMSDHNSRIVIVIRVRMSCQMSDNSMTGSGDSMIGVR